MHCRTVRELLGALLLERVVWRCEAGKLSPVHGVAAAVAVVQCLTDYTFNVDW